MRNSAWSEIRQYGDYGEYTSIYSNPETGESSNRMPEGYISDGLIYESGMQYTDLAPDQKAAADVAMYANYYNSPKSQIIPQFGSFAPMGEQYFFERAFNPRKFGSNGAMNYWYAETAAQQLWEAGQAIGVMLIANETVTAANAAKIKTQAEFEAQSRAGGMFDSLLPILIAVAIIVVLSPTILAAFAAEVPVEGALLFSNVADAELFANTLVSNVASIEAASISTGAIVDSTANFASELFTGQALFTDAAGLTYASAAGAAAANLSYGLAADGSLLAADAAAAAAKSIVGPLSKAAVNAATGTLSTAGSIAAGAASILKAVASNPAINSGVNPATGLPWGIDTRTAGAQSISQMMLWLAIGAIGLITLKGK